MTSKSIILFVNVLHVEGGLVVQVFLKQDILKLLFGMCQPAVGYVFVQVI